MCISDQDINCTERGIIVVKGYHRVSATYPTAEVHGLRWRVAYVLDTYRSDKVDMYFDAEVFCGLMDSLERFLEAERTEVYMKDSSEAHTLASMRKAIFSLPEVDQEPPKYIVFHKQGTVNCVVAIEEWAYVGGPHPYNDSFTAAIYTGEDMSEQLVEIANEKCREFGVPILEIIQASPVPVTRILIIKRFLLKFKEYFLGHVDG